MKDDHCPDLRPQKVNAFVGIGSRQGKFLDDLLPGNCINAAVGDHKKKKYIEKRCMQPVSVILDRCKLRKNACQRKQQDI